MRQTSTGSSSTDLSEYPIAGGPAALSEGDRVLWEDRSTPLTVIEPAHADGEHSDPREVAVEGPRGGIVTLRKGTTDFTWQTSSDGRVDTVVIVESDSEPVSSGRETAFTTEWDSPLDDCPFCGDLDEFTSQDYRCHYVDDGLWGGYSDAGRDTPIERTDAGSERILLRAECTSCGGVVYEHPAYSLLVGEGPDTVDFP